MARTDLNCLPRLFPAWLRLLRVARVCAQPRRQLIELSCQCDHLALKPSECVRCSSDITLGGRPFDASRGVESAVPFEIADRAFQCVRGSLDGDSIAMLQRL